MKEEPSDYASAERKCDDLVELKLLVPDDLFRAWQRCSWLIAQEKKKDRLDVMKDMVREFLSKHGC